MRHSLELTLKTAKTRHIHDGCFEIRLVTSGGNTKALLHHREGNTAGTVLVGGTGGGFDGPAGIYPELGHRLLEHRISSLRLDYRRPAQLEECILDALVGVEYMNSIGVRRIGLMGWSFGGAVVVNAGTASEAVAAVVTVASQTYGAGAVSNLSPKPLLLIHGTADRTLPASCSQDLYNRAGEPKELVLYERANHGVDQKRDQMLDRVETFFTETLSQAESN